jgi:glycine amidinotransferase/scyllo-inosamine-4-phosphate amidinotransferase 1
MYKESMKRGGWKSPPFPVGIVPDWIVEETNEDLEVLAFLLRKEDIEVFRPDEMKHWESVKTPDWFTDGQYAYCPRDNMLVVGDYVIEAPMHTRSRQHEIIAYDTIRRAAIKDGARWFSAPRPRLLDKENGLDRRKYELNNLEPVFDAANIARFGNELLYLISDSGNALGAQWLQNMLPDHTVHTTDVYNAAHIDSTIVPVEYRTVVLNGDRVNDDNLPAFLKDYKKIYIQTEDIIPQDFHEYPYASKWIAINMLALGDHRVIVEESQHKIRHIMERNGFTVIPCPLRHSRTLGGGFHCVTLDLHRSIDVYEGRKPR